MFIKSKDFFVGLGVALFATALIAYVIPTTVILPRSVSKVVLSPDFWPQVIAWILLILGGGMMLQQFMLSKSLSGTTGSKNQISIKSLFRSVTFIAFLSGFYWLLPEVGMVWGASLAYLFFSLFICNTRYRISAATVGFLLPVALYAFFYHVAGVDIPQSELMRLP